MNRRYVFFYLFVESAEELLASVVPEHRDYWKALAPAGYMGGPFGDRLGGMIIFEAPDMENAAVMAQNDPFLIRGVIRSHWIKEWEVK